MYEPRNDPFSIEGHCSALLRIYSSQGQPIYPTDKIQRVQRLLERFNQNVHVFKGVIVLKEGESA
jgi:hypothetical protein